MVVWDLLELVQGSVCLLLSDEGYNVHRCVMEQRSLH